MLRNRKLLILSLGFFIATQFPVTIYAQEAANSKAEVITQHTYTDEHSKVPSPYLLYRPARDTPTEKRSLLIYLYGAGGSLDLYNFKRESYAQLRTLLSERGYYVLVPELGKFHFMNEQAKATLDGIVAQVLKEESIPNDRVHVMGTSMGGGSSLAYALHRRDLIRSVCAVMPMTDFKDWVIENPSYLERVAKSYGGYYAEIPTAYEQNSAIKNVAKFNHIPVMLVHGNADNVVHYSHSKKLADLLKKNRFTYILSTAEGQGHKDETMQEFQVIAADFFDAATLKHAE